MLSKDDMNAALHERAGPLWKIEECLKVIKAEMPLLCDQVLLAQAEMDLSDGKCKAVDKRLDAMTMALKLADICTADAHKLFTRVIEAEDGLIVPFTGGTGKGDDDDDDGDPEIPPAGGG